MDHLRIEESRAAVFSSSAFRGVLPRAEQDHFEAMHDAYPQGAGGLLDWIEVVAELGHAALARELLAAVCQRGIGIPGERATGCLVSWYSGTVQEAAAELVGLFQQHPMDADVNRVLGKLFLLLGRPADAVPRFEQVLKSDPTNWRLSLRLVEAFRRSGAYEKAEQRLQATLIHTPFPTQVLTLLASIQWECGSRERAFATALRGMQLEPKVMPTPFESWCGPFQELHALIAKMLYESGQPEGARTWLLEREAVHSSPHRRALLAEIDRLRLEQGFRIAREKKRAAGDGRPEVVFVVDEPRVRQCKLASGLRANGWRVVLFYRNPPEFQLDAYFDEARQYHSEYEALILAKDHKPVAFHVFSPWYDDTTTAFVRHKPGKVVYDYTDVFTEIRSENAAAGVASQRFCVEEADGVCCRDLRIRHSIRSLGWRKPKRAMVLMDCCWGDQLSSEPKPKRTDGLHAVSIGSFGVERYGEHDNGYLEIARILVDQGIHFHLYPVPRQIRHPDGFEQTFSDYLELGARTGLVHMHQPVPMDQVMAEISQYHLGVTLVQALTFGRRLEGYTDAHFKYCGSTRIFDYLDAGLPVLMNREFQFQYHPLARHGVALVGDAAGLHGLKDTLEHLDGASWDQRVASVQQIYGVAAQTKRLEAFYARL